MTQNSSRVTKYQDLIERLREAASNSYVKLSLRGACSDLADDLEEAVLVRAPLGEAE